MKSDEEKVYMTIAFPEDLDHFGVYSRKTKKFCFGISELSKRKAWEKLYEKIGKDAYRWKWQIKKLPKEQNVNRTGC